MNEPISACLATLERLNFSGYLALFADLARGSDIPFSGEDSPGGTSPNDPLSNSPLSNIVVPNFSVLAATHLVLV
jgi:hypothetical protein